MNNKDIPTLTLDPFDDGDLDVEVIEAEEIIISKEVVEEIRFTEEELKAINDFTSQIDLNKSNQVLQYGVGVQKKIADFSETALNNVKTKDLGEVGEMLSNVVLELKNFDVEEEEKGLFGLFKKTSNKINSMKTKYDKAENNINKICETLETHQIQLLKDISMLDKMYDLNKDYFKELSMYIEAGKQKIEETKQSELPMLTEKATRSGLPEDAQAVRDLTDILNRFEKKVHDLELTKMISIQMAPQIRLVQGNDTIMAEKIQSTIVNTIPLWKSQMVLALGVTHSTEAAKVQREVTDMTNELLKKNAETLKTATIETAKESERGIVDIETLKMTNESLISTIDEIFKIQEEGKQKRKEAELELNKMEVELKEKLMEVRK